MVAEGLVTVQVHDDSVLVADGEDETRHLRETVHSEGLLVELDLVGGVGEGAVDRLVPAIHVVAVPVCRHLVHLVVPLLRGSDSMATQVVDDVVGLVGVEARLQ